ncbi:adhesion G-protein coupled receptor D2-like, partial [Elysia marginata]
CWLSVGNGSQWAFVGPVCVTVSFNVLVLITVLVVQYRHDVKKDIAGGQIVKNALSTILTQLPVTNVTWLLGLAPPRIYSIQYLFVIINASQGALILTCHMLCSSQIRNLLKTRFQGVELGEGQKQNGQNQQLSKSNSTGNTQSLEMDIVGEGLKPVRFAKKTNES